MARYKILDGLRGFFIIFMAIMHVNEILQSVIGKINHHYFGWVEDAQGFVFISGIVVGLVYGGILIKRDAPAMSAAVWRRISVIYQHHAALILVFLAIALLISANGMRLGYLYVYSTEPVFFTLFSLLLMTGSVHMGILPMYIFFLMATPLLLRMMRQGQFAAIAVGSMTLWLIAQTGLLDIIVLSAENYVTQLGLELSFGIFFNILGWQVIYVAGLTCGWLLVNGALDLSFLREPQYEFACALAVTAIVFLGVFDRLIFWDLISAEYTAAFLVGEQRGDLSPIYLVAFALDLFVITWLFVAGPFSSWVYVRMAAAMMHYIFTHPWLVMLGRHSLTLFAYHLVLVYAIRLIIGEEDVSQAKSAVILVASAASMFAVALIVEHRKRQWRAAVLTEPQKSVVGPEQRDQAGA